MTDSNTISVTYSDSELRKLVEEYITQQKTEFTFNGICSYIAYWAMEECNTIYESNELLPADQQRIVRILDAIVADGRIVIAKENKTKYLKNSLCSRQTFTA